MKKVEAIVEPYEVEEVRKDLARIGVSRMTVTEVHGFGRGAGPSGVYRGMRYEAPFATEAKVEVVVLDEVVEGAVAILQRKAKVTETGSADVCVFSLEEPLPRTARHISTVAV